MEYEYKCGHCRVMGQCGDHVRCQDTRHCHETATQVDSGVTAVGVFMMTTDNETHNTGTMSPLHPTPSTTNTFATKFKTLKEDMSIHTLFSTGYEPSNDHIKFIELSKKQHYLASSIPGYSTHCHEEFLSPCIDWEKYL